MAPAGQATPLLAHVLLHHEKLQENSLVDVNLAVKCKYFVPMSRKYKFGDSDKLYFISFAVVNWIDVFVRREYIKMLYWKAGNIARKRRVLKFMDG